MAVSFSKGAAFYGADMPKFEVIRGIKYGGEDKKPGDILTLSKEEGEEFASYRKVKPYVAPVEEKPAKVEAVKSAPADTEPAKRGKRGK